MAINFNCPNGHRLSCPDQQAGKPGKCPKCGTVLRVPMPGTGVVSESAAAPRATDLSNTATTSGSPLADLHEFLSEEHDTTESADDDQIVFLCPNGHRLNSPVALAGRPGQCPHCAAKFLIPSLEESLEAEEGEDFVDESQEISLDEIVIQVDTSKTGLGSAARQSSPPPLPRPPSVPVETVPAQASAAPNAGAPAAPASYESLARLLSALWQRRGEGVTIEIHLKHGEPLVPDELGSIEAGHALFAARESDGRHTLFAIAWSAIDRIVARGLKELPGEWFK